MTKPITRSSMARATEEWASLSKLRMWKGNHERRASGPPISAYAVTFCGGASVDVPIETLSTLVDQAIAESEAWLSDNGFALDQYAS